MTVDLKGLEDAVEAMLASASSLTPEIIRSWISQFRVMPAFGVSNEQAEQLARTLETRHAITMSLGAALKERDYQPWLDAAKVDIKFYFWERYRALLRKKGFSRKVIETLDEDTDRTLGLLQNPRMDGPWDRRGMVVGHVQSGKTANYIGLVAKAADAGYRVIVIIAGIHNNLRNQTQKRVDEGFVGRDSARLLSKQEDRLVGVGKIDARRRPVTLTNSVRDFNKALATSVGIQLNGLSEPAVFVIKKNATTLKHLTEWLAEHNAVHGGATIDEPMLLIDDEADNASINTGYDRDEVTRINGQIRTLLKLFSRSSYVAYTATPFANIFIDPDTKDAMFADDLFPRHFIVSLDPPTNYFGPQRVFGSQSAGVVRNIADNEELLPAKHKIDHPIEHLPPSLIEALRTFVVARAIRIIRGHAAAHTSMLVNASRFTGVQGRIAGCIRGELGRIQRSASVNGALPPDAAERDPAISQLRDTFEREYAGAGVSWVAVLGKLHEAAAPVKVVEVNSASPAALAYDQYVETGLAVIAVGGYSLSRGLTLEGLMVSYFLRNSQMYDTLMQMGRWFGYRDGYDDLCRVWIPEEAEGWYAAIAEYVDELRSELRRMAAANATPEEFGLKVRAHPGALLVTARNKMGSGETVTLEVGLSKSFIETATLRAEPDEGGAMQGNREAVAHLVEALKATGKPLANATEVSPGGWLIERVPVALVKVFIAEFKNHPSSFLTDPSLVRPYIEKRELQELAEWDVLFVSVGRSEASIEVPTLDGKVVRPQVRTRGDRSTSDTIRVTNKQRVASRGMERIGVPDPLARAAEADYLASNPDLILKGAEINYPDHIYRAVRPRPLLMIHHLQINGGGTPYYKKPVVAWSISFPGTRETEETVEYVVTTSWMRQNFPVDVDEDGEDESGT